ncbi:MAG TPA: hypothetical protein VLA04_00330 [Verrucomicrobiae bacterium]|nr:hypothetical protein [Verrucomicrobiae bacterium]
MSRDRLTITLDDALLSAVDGTIDGSSVRNRSHAIEHLIRQGLRLHELTHVVLTAGAASDQPLIPLLAEKLNATNIIRCMIISDPNHPTWATEVAASLGSLSSRLQTKILPGDFGSAAALTLAANELLTPFLSIELGPETMLPPSFLPLYTAHHQSGNVVTHLLTTEDGTTFHQSGVRVIDASFITSIPAGRADLQDVFPLLAKAGRVGTYVE